MDIVIAFIFILGLICALIFIIHKLLLNRYFSKIIYGFLAILVWIFAIDPMIHRYKDVFFNKFTSAKLLLEGKATSTRFYSIPSNFTAKAIRALPYSENKVASATGIYVLSDLLANGVNGKAQEELLTLLDVQDLESANNIVKGQMAHKSSQVELANSVWGPFLSSYKKAVKKLNAEVEKNPSPERINSWVSKKTHGMINSLNIQLPSDQKTKFVMLNAIYFKDKWLNPFLTNDTETRDFYSFDKATDKVKMMYQSDMYIPYYEDETLQAIQLPYRENDKMTFLLPKIPFDEFVQNFKADYLKLPYQIRTVDGVFIPRFTIETIQDLKGQLKTSGVETVFTTEGYRYNQMVEEASDDAELIGVIAQQAKIELEENGTKAAAVSYDMGGTSIGTVMGEYKPKLIFKADHPFIFIINDGLFIGTYAKGKEI